MQSLPKLLRSILRPLDTLQPTTSGAYKSDWSFLKKAFRGKSGMVEVGVKRHGGSK